MESKTDIANETKENIKISDPNKSNELFPDLIKTIENNNDPLNDLTNAHSAIVYYGHGCCKLRCCTPCNCSCENICEDIYKYNSLVKIGQVSKNFFLQIWHILVVVIINYADLKKYQI